MQEENGSSEGNCFPAEAETEQAAAELDRKKAAIAHSDAALMYQRQPAPSSPH